MTNQDKFKIYQKRKIYRYLIISMNFLVITLESFALFGQISYLWGLFPFILGAFFKYLSTEKRVKIIKK